MGRNKLDHSRGPKEKHPKLKMGEWKGIGTWFDLLCESMVPMGRNKLKRGPREKEGHENNYTGKEWEPIVQNSRIQILEPASMNWIDIHEKARNIRPFHFLLDEGLYLLLCHLNACG